MHSAKLVASLLVLLTLVLVVAPAQAETVNCTAITALPAIITVQGVYCFIGDLATAMTEGSAIDIQTNNVVLDLNGFKLGGLAAGRGTRATGIFADNRQNVTIKNGTVRGFNGGISLTAGLSQGHVIENIRADQNTAVGISALGADVIVRNNQVVATGGSTLQDAAAVGIVVGFGKGPRVLNNEVINTVKQGGTGQGIVFEFCDEGLAVNNRITGADIGISYVFATGKYHDNLTFDIPMPFFGNGTDAGNNN